MRLAATGTLLVIASMCGCTLMENEHSTSALRPFPTADAGPGGKVVHLDVAVIEQPIGDLYINKELWEQTDQHVVDLDKQVVLDENGFRVGQVVGTPPERLCALLMSERSCPRPRRRVTPSGSVIAQELSQVRPHAEFHVFENDKTTAVTLDDVASQLDIQATQREDGATRLRFTPKLQYGQAGPIYRSSGTGWTLDVKKPAQTFPAASWQVDLQANDLLVIGALLDRQDTLGFHAFVDEGLTPLQRLLVIRAHATSADEEVPHAEESLPLARQATMGTVRASRR